MSINALEPSPSGDIAVRPIGTAVTDEMGHFDLIGDMSDVQLQNGQAGLEVIYAPGPETTGLIYDFVARPPEGGEDPTKWLTSLPGDILTVARNAVSEIKGSNPHCAVLPACTQEDIFLMAGNGALGPDDVVELAPSAVRDLYDLARGRHKKPGPDDPEEAVGSPEAERGQEGDEEVSGSSYDGPPTPANRSATSCASGYQMFWGSTDHFRYNYVPIKFFRTLGKSSFQWSYKRTNESEFGIAMNYNGTKYSAGMGGTRYQSSGLSFAPKVGNSQRQLWELKKEYRKWRAYCYYSSAPECCYTDTYWLEVRKWAPERITGGNRLVDTTTAFECGSGPAYQDLFGATTTIARSSVVTYNNYFSIAGVELDSKSADREEQSFTVIPDSGVNAKLCGDNTSPLYAHMVKEMAS